MNKLDPHTLFSIFEQGDEEIYKEHGQQDVLKNPFVLMGMVLRGLENYRLMSLIYTRKYPELFKKQELTIKHKYYNKLFNYLNRIDLRQLEVAYHVGESYSRDEIMLALEHMIQFFVKVEEYEKCAKIVEYKDLLVLEEVYDIINKQTLKS
tara:strand:+ start:101 stop:553 length:453 start_codon:yes stop_codon:yes gene_type:complete